MDMFSNDPAKVAQWIQGLINAFLLMLIALNVIVLTDLQVAAVMTVVNYVAGAWGAWWVRRNTTTLANPTNAQGEKLVPIKRVTRGID